MSYSNLILAAFIFFFLLDGCKSKEVSFEKKSADGQVFFIKKTYDKKGNVLVEELLDKDSVRNGYYKEFILGKEKDSGNYSDGRKEGSWHHWDLAGDLIKIENWFLGKQFGEQIEYYGKAKIGKKRLYKYSFFNVEGQKIFESKFDFDGKLLTSEGTPLYCAYNTSSINKGGTYELISFLGIPEGFDWRFSVAENDKSKQKDLFKQDFNNGGLEMLAFAKRFYHTKTYLSSGTYDWTLFLQIISNSGQTVFADTTRVSVLVK